VRIRSIKPEFWRSDDVTSLEWDTRLVFIALWSYVDDNGVGADKLTSIAADLFAADLVADPAQTLDRVKKALFALAHEGLIRRYEVAGKQYLFITGWSKHQLIREPSKGHVYPLPPAQTQTETGHPAENPAESAQSRRLGTGEQGNRGTGEQGKKAPAPAVLDRVFEGAWSHWPKKTERKKALDQYKRAASKIGADAVLDAVTRFGDAYAATTEKQFVPALGVWLSHERWTDELPESRQVQQPPLRQSRGAQALDFALSLPEGGNALGSSGDRAALGGGIEY
jgi:hypothetical protein